LGFGKRNMQRRILEEVEYFLAEVDKFSGEPFDMKPLISKSIGNGISTLVFGKRFEHSDPISSELIRLLNGFIEGDTLQSPINSFPILKFLPGDLFGSKKFMRDFARVFEIQKMIVEEHRATFDEKDIRDYVDCFLLEQMNQNKTKGNHTFTGKSY
jgi:cytochrome P450 family 2 subfamily U polypeptide 1